ncbi:hypothetical protein T492DRAFT_1089064 [Pavlovales sp. CCMP2436]|nr:hypothetical protein T492DRAFT_1089064 [Pavlovales sp. CCMP2436]
MFFAPEIEREWFECFHFVHRPCLDGPGLSALAKLASDVTLHLLVAKYNGRPWSESRPDQTCRLVPADTATLQPAAQAEAPSAPPSAPQAPSDRFRTRAQRREEAESGRLGPGSVLGPGSSLAPAELRPPAWLPRGNVGSSTPELRVALANCLLSAVDIVSLGLEFALTVAAATAWFAREECNYAGGRAVRARWSEAGSAPLELCAAGGPLREGSSVAERRSAARKSAAETGRGNCLVGPGTLVPRARRGEALVLCEQPAAEEEPSDEEEWDRHVAAISHDPGAWDRSERPTYAYWNSDNQHLFEEEIEACWEKGGSGLAFYTDDAYWHAQTTTEERLVDGWDTHDHIENDGADYVPARVALEGLRARAARAPDTHARARIARRVRGPGTQAAELALDAGNSGYRMLERMGWSEDRPSLGKRRHGEVLPVAARMGPHKRDRRGLG